MSRPLSLKVLIGLLIFLGLGGLFGGAAFLLDPSGASMGLDTTMLSRAPVADFFLPGFFLLTVMGLAPLTLALALWRNPQPSGPLNLWTLILALSATLLIWLIAQYLMIGYHVFQTMLAVVGLAMLFFAGRPEVRRALKR